MVNANLLINRRLGWLKWLGNLHAIFNDELAPGFSMEVTLHANKAFLMSDDWTPPFYFLCCEPHHSPTGLVSVDEKRTAAQFLPG